MSRRGAATDPGAPNAPRCTPPIPPGGEDRDPGRMGRDHRRGDGRGGPARGQEGRSETRSSGLAHGTSGAVASVRRRLVNPTRIRPAWMATVAGTAPEARTAASDALATSRFGGYGRPWLMSVDSSATTGRPSSRARATSGAMTRRSASIGRKHTSPLSHGAGEVLPDGHRQARRRYPDAMPSQRPFVPEDIRRQVILEEHDVAADGRLAVVGRRTVRRNQYEAHLWVVPLGDGRPARARRLTFGPIRDRWPRISPDGRLVACIRHLEGLDPATSIRLIPVDGGRERALRRGIHGEIAELAWSPDGTRLAYTADVDPPRFLVGPQRPVGTTIAGTAGRPSPDGSSERTGASTASGTSIAGSRVFVVDIRKRGHVPARSRPATGESAGSPGARTAGRWRSRPIAARSRTSDPGRRSGPSTSTTDAEPREVPPGSATRPEQYVIHSGKQPDSHSSEISRIRPRRHNGIICSPPFWPDSSFNICHKAPPRAPEDQRHHAAQLRERRCSIGPAVSGYRACGPTTAAPARPTAFRLAKSFPASR